MLIDQYDDMMMALCVWREARGSSSEARRWVAHVILNRMNSPSGSWPKTKAEVVLQAWQFSSFNSNDPNASKLPHKKDKADWAAFVDSCRVVDDPGEDPTSGANAYHSYGENQKHLWPSWADSSRLTGVVGAFKFYKL
jgi:spore germination cell wall hydrolase CwlJ-like protein